MRTLLIVTSAVSALLYLLLCMAQSTVTRERQADVERTEALVQEVLQ